MNAADRASRTGASALRILPLILIIPAAGVGGWLLWKEWRWQQRGRNERAASAAVWTIASAMGAFRAEDVDGNGRPDAWTGNVRALHHGRSAPGRPPFGLIDARLAAADPSDPDAAPYHGYWFVLLEAAERDSREKVAVCAYPARHGRDGFATYLYGPRGHMKADTKGVPPARYPDEAEMQRLWAKYD